MEPKFGWVDLPVRREGKPPVLPGWRSWQAGTKKWWGVLWSKPQASMWEQDGSTLIALACLYDDLIAGRAEASRVSGEMRQHEDRHGLNPKAMLQLRWRVADGVDVAAPEVPGENSAVKRRERLRVV